ncbi:alpha/beta hydrolase [Niveibacterium sp. SC-1]|uniref:alpha/beta fold hydrolase n=1 Tax=Niveibacterium sp. SC-1 TaxID=3135646 RepID=UPI00311E63D1
MLNPEHDDDLSRFAAQGALPLPPAADQGYVAHDGAQIWYERYGEGPPVILLHGGMGNTGNWGGQVPALTAAGYSALLIDSRGHGRSTRDERPYSYVLMATDVVAVMDHLTLPRAAFVGWSDGACIALVLADQAPERAQGVLFFACNMDPSGVRDDISFTPIMDHCIGRHRQDYRERSTTPDGFDAMSEAVQVMQRSQPDYRAEDLARIRVPVTVTQSPQDEFIRLSHSQYLAQTIPGARFVPLEGVTHFAPVQRPEVFNRVVLDFLAGLG